VVAKFCDFLERRCGYPAHSYNLMTSEVIVSLDGYEARLATDVSAFERKIAGNTVLQDWV